MTIKTIAKTAIAASVLAGTGTSASAFGFDICEDVTMRLHNNSGQAVQVYDLDYYDYGQSLWRSEPVPDHIIQDGYYFTFTQNLEDVENAQTLLRFRYRVTQGGRWSGGYTVQGNTFTCRHNSTVNVYLN